jgi:hypothetical protein
MTPRQVDDLTAAEYEAMVAYVVRCQRDEQRQARRARRGG